MRRRTIEETPRLSVRELRPYIYPDGARYRLPHSVGVTGYMQTFPDRILVVFNAGHAEARYEAVPCRFGGSRLWFRCPRCAKRVGRLYLAREVRYGLSSPTFWCRRCARVGYRSQLLGRYDRALQRAAKRRRVLRASDLAVGTIPPRPKGMHWSRYKGLVQRVRDADLQALHELQISVTRLSTGKALRW